MINAHEAINENPRVFCSFGNTPAQAMKRMSKILKENSISHVSASVFGYIEDEGFHYMTVYI